MSHAFHRRSDGLFVGDAALVKGKPHAVAALRELLQHLRLHRAHELDADFFCPFVPQDVKLGLLLLEAPHLRQHRRRVHAVGEQQPVGQHRGKERHASVLLEAESLARPGVLRSRHRGDHACGGFFQGREAGAGILPDLVDFLVGPGGAARAVRIAFRKRHLHLQRAAGDLHPGEAVSLFIPRDLEHPGAEFRRVFLRGGRRREAVQQPEKGFHARETERRPEAHREQLPLPDQADNVSVRDFSPFLQVPLHQVLVQDRQLLLKIRVAEVRRPSGNAGAFARAGSPLCPGSASGAREREGSRRHRAEFHKARLQDVPELLHHPLFFDAGLVHLVHKDEHRHPVGPEQVPESPCVALHAVRPAHNEHGGVQDLKRPLRLRGEIHMSRGVQDRDLRVPGAEHRLLGINGDAALLFLQVRVQEGVAVVHPALLPDGPGGVEQRLR